MEIAQALKLPGTMLGAREAIDSALARLPSSGYHPQSRSKRASGQRSDRLRRWRRKNSSTTPPSQLWRASAASASPSVEASIVPDLQCGMKILASGLRMCKMHRRQLAQQKRRTRGTVGRGACREHSPTSTPRLAGRSGQHNWAAPGAARAEARVIMK